MDRWRSQWLDWWRNQGFWQRLLPFLIVVIYWLVLLAVGAALRDPILVGSITLLLFYGGPWTRRLRVFVLPLILTGVVYDSQRYYVDALRGVIHVVEPYEFDRIWFGVETVQGRLTPNEFLARHIHPVLDLITGFAYLVYALQYVLIAAYFYFVGSRKGTRKHSPDFLATYSPRIMWAFFFVNLAGYITYYLYPAAPPWYVSNYGFIIPASEVPPDPAGAIRFDELLGTNLFMGMYEKSANVFGAIPSLHAAYPMLAAYYAFKLGSFRVFTVLFWILICFSAVYLNHHYVVDLMIGSIYALVISLTMDLLLSRQPAALGVFGLRTRSADGEES